MRRPPTFTHNSPRLLLKKLTICLRIEKNGSKLISSIIAIKLIILNRTSHDHFVTVVIDNLTKVGNQIIEICHFIELNMTAIRKILKKFDKTFAAMSM